MKKNLDDIYQYWQLADGNLAQLRECYENYINAEERNDESESICLSHSLGIYFDGKKKRVLPF